MAKTLQKRAVSDEAVDPPNEDRVASREEFEAALERVKKDHAATFEMLADL